jgi:hypothetical protein
LWPEKRAKVVVEVRLCLLGPAALALAFLFFPVTVLGVEAVDEGGHDTQARTNNKKQQVLFGFEEKHSTPTPHSIV